jgi:hypothetical protein
MTGIFIGKFNSFNIFDIHITSFPASYIALYSASVELTDTVFCNDVFHVIKPPLKYIKYDVIDFLPSISVVA